MISRSAKRASCGSRHTLGHRIRKANTFGDTLFHYDTRGRLIAETDANGVLKRELIYLGDIPVAVWQ